MLLFAGRLGFGEGMFLFLPFAFFVSVQRDGNIICSMLKVMMLVSKERKSTRFFHSFFDLLSDITIKQRRAWTEVETVIGKAESLPCRRCSQNRRKTLTESGVRPEQKRPSDVGSNRIYRYFPKC